VGKSDGNYDLMVSCVQLKNMIDYSVYIHTTHIILLAKVHVHSKVYIIALMHLALKPRLLPVGPCIRDFPTPSFLIYPNFKSHYGV
jgi:hypothetical protein